PERRDGPNVADHGEDVREARELRVVRARGSELPAGEQRAGNCNPGGDDEHPPVHAVPILCDGCQRSARRSAAVETRWIATPRKPVASAYAYSWSFSPNDSTKFTFWPSPDVPMKSSAVNARISDTVDEMRSP